MIVPFFFNFFFVAVILGRLFDFCSYERHPFVRRDKRTEDLT